MTDSKKCRSMKYLKRIQNNLLKEFSELKKHTDKQNLNKIRKMNKMTSSIKKQKTRYVFFKHNL